MKTLILAMTTIVAAPFLLLGLLVFLAAMILAAPAYICLPIKDDNTLIPPSKLSYDPGILHERQSGRKLGIQRLHLLSPVRESRRGGHFRIWRGKKVI
jgi:hypothetical protein